MNQINVGEFIATLRKEKNLTQEQLAEKLGVNNRSISRWENGHNMPDLSLIGEVSDILGVTVMELLNGRRITKDEAIELRDGLNLIIDLSKEEKKMKAKKLNKFLMTGLLCVVLTLLNRQFDILSAIFVPNIDEFVAGGLTGLGLLFIFLGFYYNNYGKTFRQRKKAWFSKIKRMK